ncbi:hypothetical protein JK358_03225 [Nocardia sp. 2]|uniref:Secreted protein n=1 Tax=Nocardia acididurans TaxID=2802282 RepID=A0ABS1LYC5_9NOCA|nr:hypothetical protein [Nocardia acididurans]MBL1073402.1 hypothetical protein [Nocardia acididurans]
MVQKRFTAGFGLAALFAVTAAITAPQAAAQELAPGVSCVEKTCVNDTDDRYRVTSKVLCSGLAGLPVTIEATTDVPARGTAEVTVGCPAHYEPPTWEQKPPRLGRDGTFEYEPPTLKPGETHFRYVTRIDHESAQPIPSS